MKKVLFLAVFMVFAAWGQSYADYSFSYSGATGSVTGDIVATLNPDGSTYTVTGGSVTGAVDGYASATYTLLPLSVGTSTPYAGGGTQYVHTIHGVDNTGGADITWDNQLFPNSNPLLSGSGLAFVDAADDLILNFWGNGANSPYTLAVFHTGGVDYPLAGDVTITPLAGSPAPIPAAAWLLGSSLIGLVGIKRKYLG
jgi:hypothetical protein